MQVFQPETSQDVVYDCVAHNVVLGALDGYNGTIFAYGQTGSGKTYTLTGGESYRERGVIPRAISTVFDEMRRRPDMEYRCFITIMEIYNEATYDLLDQLRDAAAAVLSVQCLAFCAHTSMRVAGAIRACLWSRGRACS